MRWSGDEPGGCAIDRDEVEHVKDRLGEDESSLRQPRRSSKAFDPHN
jgi:hypothetical protein